MRPLRPNRLFPVRSLNHNNQNNYSRDSSNEKLPMHQSLNRTNKPSPFPNPYLKKFNLRKVTRTEESAKKKRTEKQDHLPPTTGNNNNEKSRNIQKNEDDTEVINRTNASVSMRKEKRFNSIRVHTQKLRNKTSQLMKDSPYKSRNLHLQTIDHEQIQNQSLYQHLTPFERDQIHRYDINYVGKRRIHSSKQFTDKNGDARVAAHDAIVYRYQVLDIIGKGSFGQVFKAYDHKKQELVALKIIRNQQKFCTQAKVQIKILEHALIKDTKNKSNIVQLKHAFFFRGHPCLVFQLLHQNLYQFLRQFNFKGISFDLIVRFGIQILQGLTFLRKYEIIHCDLKPQNILIKQKHKTGIKIIDIGSGCYQAEQIYTYIQSRFYRAPQIIIGISYTPAIDIWSFGCILAQLALGYPIFPGEDEYQQMAMFMEVFGVPPMNMIQNGCRSKKFFIENIPKIKPSKKGAIRKPNTKKLYQILKFSQQKAKENQLFLNFLSKCFEWEPQKRIKPDQALLDPWIVQSLPQQIRKQHIAQVRKLVQIM